MNNKKYELTNDAIEVNGKTLYRIKALKRINYVDPGDLGGYIQSEANLSHEGDCWIFDNAKVFDNALVCDDAMVFDSVHISGDIIIGRDAIILSE